jgi:hypothetical protein
MILAGYWTGNCIFSVSPIHRPVQGALLSDENMARVTEFGSDFESLI